MGLLCIIEVENIILKWNLNYFPLICEESIFEEQAQDILLCEHLCSTINVNKYVLSFQRSL